MKTQQLYTTMDYDFMLGPDLLPSPFYTGGTAVVPIRKLISLLVLSKILNLCEHGLFAATVLLFVVIFYLYSSQLSITATCSSLLNYFVQKKSQKMCQMPPFMGTCSEREEESLG